MNATFDAFLRSWPFEPWLIGSLYVSALVYSRGWLALHHRDPNRWPRGQPVAFGAGLSALFLALGSPIEPFTSLSLYMHMLQHVLLMMIAPPLIWLGAPVFPILSGLPRPIRRYWAAPLFRWRGLGRALLVLTHPVAAVLLFTIVTWFWHLPPNYELALGSYFWHYLQHLCFVGAALLFWYPVIRPYPSCPSWPLWLLIPYLIVADVQNTLLSAVLTFSDQPLYRYYVERPRLGNFSALEDQAAAGVLMWVPGSIAYLVPLFVIGVRLLFGGSDRRRMNPGPPQEPAPAAMAVSLVPLIIARPRPVVEKRGLDLARLPVLGRLLRWRHARLVFQVPMLLLAGLVIYDGLRGPPVAAMNLAGVLPWIHWRGLLVMGILVAGNVFCMACPFLLPRTIARRLLPRGRKWPRRLRNKWLAVFLLGLFLWAYEAFALWDSPWWTAWIALAYFAAAFAVDVFFADASFCKYVCPIGQFNFVQSLISPTEIRVRESSVCTTCQTKDCIRGREDIPGCELKLYQPRKASNMDCTFCLDCIHACPHDNVGILATLPGQALWRDSFASGIGRFARRPDLAALIVLLAFGAFVNAAGMVGPVLEWRDELASLLPWQSPLMAVCLFYGVGLVLLPALLVSATAALCRWLGDLRVSTVEVATRFSYALVPLAFSMWLAHYSYHFLAGGGAITPLLQRFAGDLGVGLLGEPEWALACCRPVADWLPRLEILALDGGLLFSLYWSYQIALTQSQRAFQALKVLAPWMALLVFLFATGIWIILQPMQMRGTLSAGG
jgi:cytochrome c oxidase assembly factor CtaG/polyferredoxin